MPAYILAVVTSEPDESSTHYTNALGLLVSSVRPSSATTYFEVRDAGELGDEPTERLLDDEGFVVDWETREMPPRSGSIGRFALPL